MEAYGWEKFQLHTFLTSELVTGELLAKCFDSLTPGKETPLPTESEAEWSREPTSKPDRSVPAVNDARAKLCR